MKKTVLTLAAILAAVLWFDSSASAQVVSPLPPTGAVTPGSGSGNGGGKAPIDISVEVRCKIPNFDSALKSPVPRLLEFIYLIDKGMFDYMPSFYHPETANSYGPTRLVDEYIRPWYGELTSHGGLHYVGVSKIVFEGDMASISYAIYMKDSEVEHEVTQFKLSDGEWCLYDRDL